MTRAVLTLNAGSSSLKVALFPAKGDAPLAVGLVDRIGPEAQITLKMGSGAALPASGDLTSHLGAMHAVLDGFRGQWPDLDLVAVGHRVVHGGADFAAPAIVDDAVLDQLDRLSPFAPLHQPHNLTGIRAAIASFPDVPQVACFDTAFHRNHPWVNDTYALPQRFYDQGVRRYGFHGLSYEYVSGEFARIAPDLAKGRVVVAHLGNGASLCAIEGGRSMASTMGFSPLDGLAMGTRCGQIDPGVILYLMDQQGMDAAAISDLLYKQSGLLGLSGLSNDMRTLAAAQSPKAQDAIAYFCARCQREIASMAAAMGGMDALIFCGGIGENARGIRALICDRLGWMGVAVDPARNAENLGRVSPDAAQVPVFVIPTNEELVIARAARAAVQ
ncbi:acetate/propionate family kinase [Pseudotabrizicola sp. L79]|uniref:acetate/propionate family kinase n=1 Tax=Pseudotabrizicola sp. L79 TaxID=3118402 RepID=UPI002F95FB4B